MTTRKRLNKKKSIKTGKKRKIRSGMIILIVVSIFLTGIGVAGYSYIRNYLNEREERQAALKNASTKPVAQIIRLEINEADTIASLAQKIAKTFPKLGLSPDQIITELNNRNTIKTLQKTYPFIPDSVLDPAIKYPLEGLFAPLTYDFYETDTLDIILKKPLDAMNLFYQKYNSQIVKKGSTFYNAIIHASVTNAEVPSNDKVNMALVSQVFTNRLNQGIGLGSDATLVYALQKKDLTRNDFNNNSSNPYNTRKNLNLPPTPIQFVTETAIEAFINPTANNYYYFLTGTCANREDYQQFFYSTTYDEHNINIQKHMVC